eukprot:174261-Rhodomonas_salina.1
MHACVGGWVRAGGCAAGLGTGSPPTPKDGQLAVVSLPARDGTPAAGPLPPRASLLSPAFPSSLCALDQAVTTSQIRASRPPCEPCADGVLCDEMC